MSLSDALLLDPHPFEVWIAWRTDGIQGCGTLNDPYNGSTAAKFDSVMTALPANAGGRIHLGPSPRDANDDPIPFQTAGFWIQADGTSGSAWQPRANTTIVGSGIDVTYLQLTGTTTTDRHYFAIGAPTTSALDFLEISDMTIDCNLPPSANVACGAVRVMGNHVRVRRVKCINWGNRTTAQPGFVIALIIADPDSNSPVLAVDDVWIDDCIAVNPSANNTVEDTFVNILHVGGRELTSNALTQFGRGPYIRNCFVDCGSPTTPVAEYRGLSMGGCHGGIVEGNQIHNTRYGGPYQDVLNTREIIVRNNIYRNVLKGPCWSLDGDEGVGVQKLLVEGNHIELIADTGSPTPIGIHVDDQSAEEHPYGQVIIRNNKIRYLDGTPGSFNGYGIEVAGAAALLVFDNVVEVNPSDPIRSVRCDAARYFDNRTLAGMLLPRTDPNTLKPIEELDIPAEDTLVASLYEKA